MSHISYSQFSMWKTCPRWWKLIYPDQNKIPSVSIHLLFGSALNDTIELYLTTYYNQTEKAANELDLNKFMLERMIEIYNEYEKLDANFTSKKEMMDFYTDGVKIIDWFKRKRDNYFSKRGYEFIGCEVKLEYPIRENVFFTGRIDCAIKDLKLNKVKIIDFKKSMRGWDDETKKNPTKRGQLQLYKKFYSAQNNFPLENIEIEFMIFKQKIWEKADFPPPRIQRYSPPSSERSINQISKELDEFVDAVFNQDGSYNMNANYDPLPSKYNCKFCPFRDKKELCDVGVK